CTRREDGQPAGQADRADRSQRAADRVRDRAPRRSPRGRRRRVPRRPSPARRRVEDGGMTDGPQYDVQRASKVFTKGALNVRAVDDVSLEIGAGEFVALEGPSGSGKTTLLQLLGALDRPSAGHVFFEGRDLASL